VLGTGVLRPVYSCCMFWVHVCINGTEDELGLDARAFWVRTEDWVGRA
jgi:hypothetical protein